MDMSLPLVSVANERGRRIDVMGSGRDCSWSGWRMNEGLPSMRVAMADPARLEFAPAGDAVRFEWFGGYSDYVFIPVRFLRDSRLQLCLEVLAWHGVFIEVAIPTCAHMCVLPVPEASLVYQEHGRAILWGQERRIIERPTFSRRCAQTLSHTRSS